MISSAGYCMMGGAWNTAVLRRVGPAVEEANPVRESRGGLT
jgi:hypothetical protein